MICPYYPAPFLFFISSQVPVLLYYSHIPILIVSIFVGVFILVKDHYSLLSRALVIPLLLFDLWIVFDLITWVNNSSDTIMFVWSFFGMLLVLINFYFFRFLYIFIKNKELPFSLYLIFFILLLPVILLTPTNMNLRGFDSVLCASLENNYFINYYHLVGLLILFYTCFFVIKSYLKSDRMSKSKILLAGSGLIPFLFLFLLTSFSASILKYFGLVENYQIEQYGFFPIIIFIVLLGYLIIKYKTFNIKLIATQLLVWAIVVLVGAQFFFIKVPINFVLTGITFAGTIFFGRNIIKSIKKEIQQKEHLEKLSELLTQSKNRLEETNIQLEDANVRLQSVDKLKTEFVSLASHQLRSPLTAIKGYTSMLMSGDFGEIGVKQKEAISRVFESSEHLIKIVEDLLNVSKIEMGGMQYVMKPFDFEKQVHDLEKDLSMVAEKKGIKFSFETDKKEPYMVNGDMEKLRQVVLNLIDNSVKYTKKGSVKVKLEKIEGKIRLSIKDTGMGVTPEIKETLFQKFSRGDGGKVDTGGSGLGLYLAKQIIEAHKGLIWIESDGIDKGSTFFIELKEVI